MKIKYCLFLSVLIFFSYTSAILADQSSFGIANSFYITGETKENSIVCSSSDKTNSVCTREYDPDILGVIDTSPAIAFESKSPNGLKTIVASGRVQVMVSGINGPISSGDYITSSSIPGVGQKATKSGYILGIAMEDFKPQNKLDQGKITVTISIKPAFLTTNAQNNLFSTVGEGIDGAFKSPLSALRYFVSGIIVVASFVLAFNHYGKVAKTGIEALGRNPLAGKTIQFGVMVSVFVMISIMILGLIVSYLVLIL